MHGRVERIFFSLHAWGKWKPGANDIWSFAMLRFIKTKMWLEATFTCSLHPNCTFIAEPLEGTIQHLTGSLLSDCLSRRKQVVCHFLPLSDQANTHTQYTYLEKFSLLMTLTFSANNIFSAIPVQVNRVHSGNRRSRTIWESIKMNWPELQFWKHCKLFPFLDKVITLGRNTFVAVTCPLIVWHLSGNRSTCLLNYDAGRWFSSLIWSFLHWQDFFIAFL